MWRKSSDEDLIGDLGDGPGELDTGRPAPDDGEREEPLPALRGRLAVGLLEGEEDPPADLERVFEILEARSARLPVFVAEIRVPRARGDHQGVVGEDPAVAEGDLATVGIDGNDLGQHDVRVLLAAQDRPDGVRDVGGGKGRRRHLIEEGLEEVMVPPVDHRDPDRSAGEAARRFEPSESGAHDHDVRPSV